MTGHSDVDQHTAGTATLSPARRCTRRSGLVSTLKASRFADEPELTMTAYGAPQYLAKFSSNCRTFAPMVSWPLSSVAMQEMIS